MSMAGEDDVLEQGGGRSPFDWRPSWLSRGGAILAACTLLAGLAAGYAAGQSHAHAGNRAAVPTRPRAEASSATPLELSPALTQNTMGCSAQVGRNVLQLGIPVTNQSAEAVTLAGIDVMTPLSGLRIISQQWGPCGALSAGQDGQEMFGNNLAAGATTWLTVTVKVLVKCPGPLPVQFAVSYDAGGQQGIARLPGFSDLSQVPYTGCPAN